MRMRRQLFGIAFLLLSFVPASALPAQTKKNLNNLDKIGNRNVAHRSMISPEKEAAIGKQYAAALEKAVEMVQDPDVQRYVTAVAEKVARNSDWKGPVTVQVVKSHAINSLSLPGGYIYLSSGLLQWAEDEDEIAGMIAHQVAHSAARHWAAHMTNATPIQIAMMPLLFGPTNDPTLVGPVPAACSGFLAYHYLPQLNMSPAVYSGLLEAYLNGTPVTFLPLKRKDELEADYLGLQYVYKAGYDPHAYVALLRKLASMQPGAPLRPDAFQVMPPYPERIAKAEEEIRTILPEPRAPTKPSPEFTVMKTRL